MPDTNLTDFDSGRSIAEKLRAEVLDTSPNTYFVQYDEDDADIEPRTTLNELLFEGDEETRRTLYDFLVYGEPIAYEWSEEVDDDSDRLSSFLNRKTYENHTIEVRSEDGGAFFELSKDGDTVPVPPDYRDEIFEVITKRNEDLDQYGQTIRRIYREINDSYAARDIVAAFLDRWNTDRIRPARNGWVIDDTFLVQWDGSNYLLGDSGSYGTDIARVDGDEEFLQDLAFHIDGPATETAPDGETYELTENELEFLATVEVFVNPEDHLGHDLSGRIVNARSTGGDDDTIGSTASTVNYNGFHDPSIGRKHHGHTLEKHTLTASFGVTSDVIDRLHFAQNTHGGVNELARREREFRRADFDVFHDTDNGDDARWKAIKSRARSAPIKDEVQRQMDAMFGGV